MKELQPLSFLYKEQILPIDASETSTPADNTLTFGVDPTTGGNIYDFASKAAHITVQREKRGIPETEPFPNGPWTMEIMPTDICNASCEWCSYRFVRKDHVASVLQQRKAGEIGVRPYLPRENVMCLLDTLEAGGDTKGTYWAGGGEPLTAPYIADVLYRAGQFSDVFLQTNGILLNRFITSPDVLGSIRLLSISAVGYDKDSTEAVHHTNSFQRIDENVRNALAIRNTYRERYGETEKLASLKINAKIMVDRTNYLQLPQMVHYWRDDIAVDTIAIRSVQDYNYGIKDQQVESVELTREQKLELYTLIMSFYKGDKDLMRFAHYLSARAKTLSPTRKCFSALQGHFGVVDAKGDVYIGNPEIGTQEFSIGNIKNQTWSTIWGSERHKDVINRMNEIQEKNDCNLALCRHVSANQGVQEYYDGVRLAPDEKIIMEKGNGSFM